LHVSQGLGMVMEKIMGYQKAIAEELTKLDNRPHQTADTMSLWKARVKERNRLDQLLEDIIRSLITASQSLHQLDYVSLNLQC